VGECQRWVAQGMQASTDETFRDPTNLRSKQAHHQVFEAKMVAHHQRLDGLRTQASDMASRHHPSAADAAQWVAGLA